MNNKDFWVQLYDDKKDVLNGILQNIEHIVYQSGSLLEGNSFYYHNTLQKYPELFAKQINLYWAGIMAETRICEIGFNAGHSAMLMLLGRNPTPIDFTIFDIGHHYYTKPCLEYIKNTFPHVQFEFIEGDSTVEMPLWIEKHPELIEQYEIIHVDGGHTEHCIRNDMENASKLVKPNGIIIIDDTDDAVINSYVNMYLQNGNYEEVKNIHSTFGYPHRMIRKLT